MCFLLILGINFTVAGSNNSSDKLAALNNGVLALKAKDLAGNIYCIWQKFHHKDFSNSWTVELTKPIDKQNAKKITYNDVGISILRSNSSVIVFTLKNKLHLYVRHGKKAYRKKAFLCDGAKHNYHLNDFELSNSKKLEILFPKKRYKD